MRGLRLATCAVAVATLGGCAKPGNFEWGTYDESLYEYYRDSGNLDKLTTELDRLSIAYGDTAVPELGELLTKASSDDPAARRKAVALADLAFQPLDKGPVARLAPGLVAELGYLYMEAGNPEKAITLFRREQRNWPEAAYFMDVMIRVAKGPDKSRDGERKSIEEEAARLRQGAGK